MRKFLLFGSLFSFGLLTAFVGACLADNNNTMGYIAMPVGLLLLYNSMRVLENE